MPARARYLLSLAVVAATYGAAAWLGLVIRGVPELTALTWVPSGVSLGVLLVWGTRLWPAIAIGALATVTAAGYAPATALTIAGIETGEALLGVLLLRTLGFRAALDRARDVVALVGVGAVIAIASATASVLGLHATQLLVPAGFEILWSTWWWGHLSADLVITPLVLVWGTRAAPLGTPARPFELVGLAVVSTILLAYVFLQWFPNVLPGARSPYYLVPLLLWVGVRLGPRAAATAVFAIGGAAIAVGSLGGGVFRDLDALQAFVSIASITTLTTSATASERMRMFERKDAIMKASHEGVITIDERGVLVEANPAATRMFQLYERGPVAPAHLAEMVPPLAAEARRESSPRDRGSRVVVERLRFEARRMDGMTFPAEVSVMRIPIGVHVLFTACIRDITADVEAALVREQARRELEDRVARRTLELEAINRELERRSALLREAEALAHVGSFELDAEQDRLDWSDELFRIYGQDPATFIPSYEAFLACIHPDDRARVQGILEEATRSGRAFTFEDRIVKPDGSVRLLLSRGTVTTGADMRVTRIAGCCQDITEQRHVEEQQQRVQAELRESLREKEVLLREIHHRVKNNLQVISSLLSLQMAGQASEQARRGLVESQSRIQSMALVHQLLYQSKDLARIDLAPYVAHLTRRLGEAYNVDPDRIAIVVRAEQVWLDIDRAISCGLILNELAANSLGHAFPGDRRGEVSVELACRGDRIELVVRDDGIGMPPGIEVETARTFGLQIAQLLVRQLGGTIQLERGRGTTIRIEFAAGTSEARSSAA